MDNCYNYGEVETVEHLLLRWCAFEAPQDELSSCYCLHGLLADSAEALVWPHGLFCAQEAARKAVCGFLEQSVLATSLLCVT